MSIEVANSWCVEAFLHDEPQQPRQVLSYHHAEPFGGSPSSKWLQLSIPIAFTAASFVAWYLTWQWGMEWDLRLACMIAAGFSAAWFFALRVLLFSRVNAFWKSLKIISAGVAIFGCVPLAEVIRYMPNVVWWPPQSWDNGLCWAVGLIGAGVIVDVVATLGARLTRGVANS